MKWSSHKAITRQVLTALKLPETVIEKGVEGSVEPDVRYDYVWVMRQGKVYRVRARHHGAYDLAIKYVWLAREMFLAGKLEEAAHMLGRAMHYIHDTYTSKGSLRLSHDELEEKIAELEVPREAIEEGFMDAVSDPFYVESAIQQFSHADEPHEVLWRATYISALVAKAVFTRGSVGAAIRRYAEMRQRRNNAAITATVFWIFGITLFFALHLTAYTLSVLLPIVVMLLFASLSTAMALHHHQKAIKIVKWFNLKTDLKSKTLKQETLR